MTQFPPTELPWWRSKVIIGALVSIITKVLVLAGVAGDISEAETAQIVDLVLIVFGGLGDLVAIGARVRQKYAPPIVSKSPKIGGSAMLSLVLACMVIVPLTACTTMQTSLPASPAAIADRSKVDEQAALTLTLAYTGAARAAALAIETGLVNSPVTIQRIGELDRQAYGAVKATEAAYQAGNADSYAIALIQARSAIGDLLASVKGDVQ